MKALDKILYFILALIVAICLFIALCAVNPDVANFASGLTKNLVPAKELAYEHKVDALVQTEVGLANVFSPEKIYVTV